MPKDKVSDLSSVHIVLCVSEAFGSEDVYVLYLMVFACLNRFEKRGAVQAKV